MAFRKERELYHYIEETGWLLAVNWLAGMVKEKSQAVVHTSQLKVLQEGTSQNPTGMGGKSALSDIVKDFRYLFQF